MEIGFKKGYDNHAYPGLMQRILCELSNLSNKLKCKSKHGKQKTYHVLTACHTFLLFIFVFLA